MYMPCTGNEGKNQPAIWMAGHAHESSSSSSSSSSSFRTCQSLVFRLNYDDVRCRSFNQGDVNHLTFVKIDAFD